MNTIYEIIESTTYDSNYFVKQVLNSPSNTALNM